jgi:hypothetical protein
MERESQQAGTPAASCNVSSTLNFTIGALALVAAIVIAYFLWRWLG